MRTPSERNLSNMIRLALVGTNEDAEKYARLISRVSGARLSALAVRGARPNANFAKQFETIADDLNALVASHPTRFDAVVALGKNRDDLAPLHQAAEAGKHLLMDDLYSFSISDAAALDRSCASAGVLLMPADSLRFRPDIHALWSSLRSGQLGECGLVRIHSWGPKVTTSSTPLASLVDLALWCFCDAPKHTYAMGRLKSDSASLEYEYLQAHFGFEDGGMALIDHTRTLPAGEGYFSMTLVGSKGSAYADDHHNIHLLYRGSRPVAMRANNDDIRALASLKEFVSAIEQNRSPLASGAHVLRANQLSAVVAESLVTKSAINTKQCSSFESNPLTESVATSAATVY